MSQVSVKRLFNEQAAQLDLIWLAGQPDSPVAQDAMKERLLQAGFVFLVLLMVSVLAFDVAKNFGF